MSLHHSPDKNYLIDFENYDATKIVFGEGAFSQLGAELMLGRISHIAVVTGGPKSARESGAYDDYIRMISGFDLDSAVVHDIPPEPDDNDVRRILETFQAVLPQMVVAIGGGSVMDAAKAAYLSWQTGLDVTELFGFEKAGAKFPDKTFERVICIPTTAGTGSEVTPYANIVDSRTGVKQLIMDRRIVPALSFVDPTFTETMPRDLTVSTALDAMVHSIESLLNTKSKDPDPRAETWALESVRLIHYALPRVLENPHDRIGREMLSAAATLGGMCIKNRPTSLPHLCSFSMVGKLSHGIAVAAFLAPFWNYYLEDPAVREQTMKLAGIFDSTEQQTTPESIVSACASFIAPFVKTDVFTKETIAKIASEALQNPVKLASAPRSVPPENAEKIISSILTEAFSA